MAQDRIQGTVKWFDATRGFGFVVPEGGGRDAFAHHSEIMREPGTRGRVNLTEGEPVSYIPVPTDKGVKATLIRRGR